LAIIKERAIEVEIASCSVLAFGVPATSAAVAAMPIVAPVLCGVNVLLKPSVRMATLFAPVRPTHFFGVGLHDFGRFVHQYFFETPQIKSGAGYDCRGPHFSARLDRRNDRWLFE
jgi:anaerobic C4-dicarboxylate transporter